MSQIAFTQEADTDLEIIAAHAIHRLGKEQARAYREGLFGALEQVAKDPTSGSDESQVRENLRCATHDAHAIYYLVRDQDVLIVRILRPGLDPLKHE